ncbi:MAG: ABC transporter substrate-binding protein, partial [Candidatus Electrothrix sp. EH2]|nr:ABC transporter substrate-binding protein [Candidatus Electrothrix sp. EH2]
VNRWYAALDQRLREKQLPAPGNWDFVSLESVLALRPDLVLIWSEQTETIAALEARGIPVFGVSLKSIDDVYQEIEALGRLTGREARAAEIIAWTKGELTRFTARIPADADRPRLYYMWAQGDLETSCGGSTVNDLISMAGGRNVCGQLHKEHTTLSREHLLRWNPEVLVMWYNERKSPKDILADPQWKNVAAVRQGRVHEFPEVFLCDLWTLKFVHAVKMVAKWTHPTLFADIDLRKEQEEMLLRLYGKKLSRL